MIVQARVWNLLHFKWLNFSFDCVFFLLFQSGEEIGRRYVIVGPIDLKTAAVYRQIINSLEIRSLNEGSSVLYSTVSNLPHTPGFSSSLFTEQLMVWVCHCQINWFTILIMPVDAFLESYKYLRFSHFQSCSRSHQQLRYDICEAGRWCISFI